MASERVAVESAHCAPAAPKRQPHDCETCRYSRKIRDLISRQQTQADKDLVDDLFSRLFHAEEDAAFMTGKYEKILPLKALAMGFHFEKPGKRLAGHWNCWLCDWLEQPL